MLVATIRLNKTLLTAAFMTLLYATASHADALTIEQLMQTLANTKPEHATFTEKKYIALLDKPVESSGELYFSAPDHLEKRTLQPQPESLIVDGNKILIERGSQTYYFTTQNLPELGVLINSIRGTLAGNLSALERSFQLSLKGNIDKWTLQLIPTNEKMQKLLQHIQIVGINSQIHSIEVSQVDGDRSYMMIKPTSKTP
ncbi:MAG: LolA-related protein [Methylophilaceae bacterium]